MVYFVGCVSSFAPRAQRIAEAFVHMLDAAGVNFTILGGRSLLRFPAACRRNEPRCRSPDPEEYRRCVGQWGAKTVSFTCPACRLMWLEEYLRHARYRLLHSTEMMAGLINAGLEDQRDSTSVTYHDPCDLAGTGGVFEAPRGADAIPGSKAARSSRTARERAVLWRRRRCGNGQSAGRQTGGQATAA